MVKSSQPDPVAVNLSQVKALLTSAGAENDLKPINSTFATSALLVALQTAQNISIEEAQRLVRSLEQQGSILRVAPQDQQDSNETLYRFATVIYSEAAQCHRAFWRVSGPNTPENATTSSKRQGNRQRIVHYVPKIVIRDLNLRSGALSPPICEQVHAAVLFADISGFTSLTERLVSLGARGFEQLASHLNRYFSCMISIIDSHGGDIVKFAGDALFIIWPTSSAEGLAYSALAASQCALALIDQLAAFSVGENPLSLHLGVSCGQIFCIHVGEAPRMEFVIAGLPVAEAAECEESARPGQVFISHKVYELLESSIKIKLRSLRGGVEEREDAPRHLLQITQPVELTPISSELKTSYLSVLENYAPEAVIAHLQAGNPDDFLAEIRTISVLFIQLHLKIDQETLNSAAQSNLEMLHISFVVLEEIIRCNGGSIRQFIVDDKGTVVIAVFGLPPNAQEDDAARALRAGLTVKSQLEVKLGVRTSVGITTGNAFCGAVGSNERREYAVVGDVVVRLLHSLLNMPSFAHRLGRV